MRIYSAPVLAQVMLIKHVLEMHDIACHIQGEYRSGGGRRAPANRDMARVVGRRSVERRGGEAARGRGTRAGGPGAARLDVPELPGRQRGPVRPVLELRGERSRGPGRLRADCSRDIDQRSQGRRGASVGLGACPGSAASGRPVAACATIAGQPVRVVGPWRESRRTNGRWSGPRHPPDPQGARSYAVPRRTRRRGEAGRGAAALATWDRWLAGTACACCAR